MATLNQTSPKVGDKATILCWGDKHACTVIGVNGKQIVVQEDKATNIDPNAHWQGYSNKFEIVPNPEGAKRTFSLRQSKISGSAYVELGFSKCTGAVLDLTRHTHSEDWMR